MTSRRSRAAWRSSSRSTASATAASTDSVERINPTTEAGTRAILVFVQIPNPDAALKGGMFATGRIKLAAGSPVADAARRSRCAARPGRPSCGPSTAASSRGATSASGGATKTPARVELKTTLPAGAQVLAARFDNLKEGAPAVIRAPASTKAARAG